MPHLAKFSFFKARIAKITQCRRLHTLGVNLNKYLLSLAFLVIATQAIAGEVTISQAWARATVPGQDSATVSLHIKSNKNALIVAVSSFAANAVETHSMIEEDGMMKMRPLETLPLKANQEMVLGGNGYHLMLVGLKKPLNAGESVPLTLTLQFEDKHREKIVINAEVRPITEGH